MKPNPTLNPHAISVDPFSKTSGNIGYFRHKKPKKQKTFPPPDEACCLRLNAIAKEYPFCIYYREKSHDPL
jgi:hypothetical protein